MTRVRTTLGMLLGAFLGTLLVNCSDVSGNCDGLIDGDLYELRIFNCTDGVMTVKVNGRAVGSVEPVNDNDVCGVTDFGTFPQCTTGKIEAYAYQTLTDKLKWNEDAVNLNPDRCWVVATIVDNYYDAGSYELPAVDPVTGPQCSFLEREEL